MPRKVATGLTGISIRGRMDLLPEIHRTTGLQLRATRRAMIPKSDPLILLGQVLQGAYIPIWTCPKREEHRRDPARIETRPMAGRGMDLRPRRRTADNHHHHQDWPGKLHPQPDIMSRRNTVKIGLLILAARLCRKNRTWTIRVTSTVNTRAATLTAIAENQQSSKKIVLTCSVPLDRDQCPPQNQNPSHPRRCLHRRPRRHGFPTTSPSPVPEHQPPLMWPETDVGMRSSGQYRHYHPAAPPRLEVALG